MTTEEKENKIYGYVRISTKAQYVDETHLKQMADLKAKGVKDENIYFDNLSGFHAENRDKLQELLSVVEAGDTIIVTKLDRLARSVADSLEIAQELQEKNVTLHVLDMGVMDNTPTGRLIFTIFSAFAEFERSLIMDRLQNGRQYKRENDPDYKDGRKKKIGMRNKKTLFDWFESGTRTNKELAQMFNVSERTIVTIKKEWRDTKDLEALNKVID